MRSQWLSFWACWLRGAGSCEPPADLFSDMPERKTHDQVFLAETASAPRFGSPSQRDSHRSSSGGVAPAWT